MTVDLGTCVGISEHCAESGEVGKWESWSEERVDLSTHKGRDRRDQFYFRHTAYPGFLNIRAGIIGSISYHKSTLP